VKDYEWMNGEAVGEERVKLISNEFEENFNTICDTISYCLKQFI